MSIEPSYIFIFLVVALCLPLISTIAWNLRPNIKAWDVARCRDLCGTIPRDDNEADAILIGMARINEFEGNID